MKRKTILLIMLLLLGFSYSNAQYGPVVSFGYDDGYPSWWDTAFPMYQEYGFPAVGWINAITWWMEGVDYHAIEHLHVMQAAGWEVSSHTYDHNGISEYNVSTMKHWLDSLGFLNSGFQSPGNDWTHSDVNIVKKYHPYYSGGTYSLTNEAMSQPYDIYRLRRFSLTNDVNIQTVKDLLDSAVANNQWIIFYGHQLGSGGYDQSPALLQATFDEIVAREIPVKTVREVINDLYPPGCVIECSADTSQYPVLNYFEEGDSSLNTSVWNEYWHKTNWTEPRYIGTPVVYSHTSNDTLPVMKFYGHIPDGDYEVRATIIPFDIGRTYRLYYSFNNENNPSQDSVEVNKNSDVSLGRVTVTNGEFALYTQKANVVSGDDGFVGWAYIRLITQASANVKVYLEGSYAGSGTMTTSLNSLGLIPFHHPYNDTLGIWNYTGSERVYNMPADIVDWVLVELRTGTAANTTVGRRAALLKSDGTIVDLDGISQVKFKGIVPGSYYIVIRHRNHLPIMSANSVSLDSTNSILYDFSVAQTQAYGTEPMKDLGGGVFGMYSGDINNSGIITAADKSVVNSMNLSTGYYNADTNFSGIVTAADKTNINSNNLKQEFVP